MSPRNPLAFPRPHSWDEAPKSGMHEGDRPEPHGAQDGMSLRDYFAGQALMGYWASEGAFVNTSETIARSCYEMADAMLKARVS